MSTDAAVPRMPGAAGGVPRRPVGVVLAAVVLGLMACFVLLMSVGMFFGSMVLEAGKTGISSTVVAVEIVMGVIGLSISIFLGFVVVGLFRMKRWARISILVIGGAVAILSSFNALTDIAMSFMASSFLPQQSASQISPELIRLMFLGTGGVSLLIALVGVWWLVYFNLRRVRTLFATPQAPEIAAMSPSLLEPATQMVTGGVWIDPNNPVTPRKSTVEILVICLAALYLLGSAELVILALMRMPLFLFGYVLHGTAAMMSLLFFGALNTALGIGLLRRVKAAWAGAMLMTGLGALAELTFLLPGNRSALLNYMQELNQQMWGGTLPATAGSQIMLIQGPIFDVSIILGMVVVALVFWLLIKARPLFEPKATAN